LIFGKISKKLKTAKKAKDLVKPPLFYRVFF
jgi:hypothetical protein